jgi:hypothetical protein
VAIRLGNIGCLIVVLLALSAPAQGGALLRITSLNDAFPSDTTTSPVLIGGDGFRLTYISEGGGHGNLVDPVLLILGVPNAGTAPVLGVQDFSGVLSVAVDLGGTANFFGGTWDTASGLAGTFDGSLPGNEKVYADIVGFDFQGNGSQNYSNWTTDDPSPTTTWNIFVYALTLSDFGPSDWVDFTGTLVPATYVIAYGCDQWGIGGACAGSGNVHSTPFTYAGLVGGRREQQVVPEPTTLLLLGAGLALVAARARLRGRDQRLGR